MARKGITESDVAKAMSALKEAGLTSPSVRMIHQKLGQGSLSTIVKHKRAIEAEARSADPNLLPDAVQEKITDAMQTLWAELAEAADGIVQKNEQQSEKINTKHQEAKDRAAARAEEAMEEVAAMKQRLAETVKERDKLKKDIDKLEEQRGNAVENNRTLKSELAQQSRENSSLLHRIEQLEAERTSSASRFDEAVKQQRIERSKWEKDRRDLQKAQEKDEKAKSSLESDIAVLTTQLESLRSLSADYKQDRDRIAAENKVLHRAQTGLSKSNGALESAVAIKEKQLKTLEKQWKEKFSTLEKAIAELKKPNKTKRTKLA